MADVFISYASPDRERARMLARTLEQQGWSVWWDRVIPPGRAFDEVIEEALTAARCVVVLWSAAAVISDWVKTEAAEAADRRILVPALIEDVRMPLQFRRFQAADLTRWTGAANDPELAKLCASIAPLVGGQAPTLDPPPPPKSSRERKAMTAAALGLIITAVVIWTMTARVAVPAVVGQTLDRAKSAIIGSGLIAGEVTEERTDTPSAGIVLKQIPAGGTKVRNGTPVALVVAAARPAAAPSPQAKPSQGPEIIPVLPSRVAFDVKKLGIQVMFVHENSALDGLLTGVTGPGGVILRLDSGPAMKAGMRAGDVITRIAGLPIESEDDLRQAWRKIVPGVTRFTIKRGKEELKIDVDCPGCY